MFENLKPEIKKHLLDSYPREGCGIIVKPENFIPVFIPCSNIADEPCFRFQIKRQITQNLHNGVLAVVHSHADGILCPSEADMKCQIESMVPWGLAVTDHEACGNMLWFGDQVERRQLIGRGFCHGVTDCYALIRDWYREHEVNLPDFPRGWEWWKNSKNLYENHFKDAGFKKLDSGELPKIGDLCLIKIRSKYINHAAVLVDNETILHHPCGNLANDPARLSVKDPIGRWLKHIQYWIRLNA